MKAIILAAGQGSRLAPLTDDKPKCLVEYQGKAIIDYILSTLRQCDINDIVIVRGYLNEILKRNDVRYAYNAQFATSNMVETLFCARDYLNDDVIISYGDIIYGPDILQALIESDDEISVTVDRNWLELWQARMEDPLSDAETMKINANGFITELGKKPLSLDEVQGQYMGLIKIKTGVWPRLKAFYDSLDRNAQYENRSFEQMYMTTFLQLIIDKLMPVKAVMIEGNWLEIDSPSDLNYQITL